MSTPYFPASEAKRLSASAISDGNRAVLERHLPEVYKRIEDTARRGAYELSLKNRYLYSNGSVTDIPVDLMLEPLERALKQEQYRVSKPFIHATCLLVQW